MKIALFTSGFLRTFRYQFAQNFDIIRRDIGDCEIDLFYSFWSKNNRSDRINDDWHSKISDTCFPVSQPKPSIKLPSSASGAIGFAFNFFPSK